ncbi:hypothetical protein LMH87_003982 [Akanthomyces muscarius]|uniref:Cytochrome P450 monooxygenase n=1 Tax=Akanthomyces muscarius TaxID=2231603 RepID=A0A9W8UH71_AKAMU|nr:hypothetical protein LMH87_003982 [Akanthomyces muscarius]KAJ4145123.1 hypothetical protein LMH87_003982 [Akanthomyces muscarius]
MAAYSSHVRGAVDALPRLSAWSAVSLMVTVALVHVAYILLYNTFFHSLRKFPGPWLHSFTSIPHTRLTLSGSSHRKHLALHLKYGPVVRIAPNILSFNHPDALKDLRGHRKAGEPEHSKDPVSIRFNPDNIVGSNREHHTRFRRALAHGFSSQAMLEQEPTFRLYVDQLFARLQENCSNGAVAVDLAKWYTFTAFDMIGDLAFGESFGCLESSTYHPWVALAFESLKSLAFLIEIGRYPNMDVLLKRLLPGGLLSKFAKNKELSTAKVQKRLDSGSNRPDFIGKITEGSRSKRTEMTFEELASNASVLIVAGSETSATLLSAAIFFLTRSPKALALLTDEVRHAFSRKDDIGLINTQGLSYMQAVLEEALRMYPPVAGGGSARLVAKGGVQIADYFIPENALVENDMWALHHNPKYFTRPDDFVPERWLGDKAFKDDRLDSVKPFSIGPRNCIGMNLAYSEMRMILARTIWEFDIRLAESSQNWYDQSRVYLAWQRPPLNVYLTPRRDVTASV